MKERDIDERMKTHSVEELEWRYEGLGVWSTEDIFTKLQELGIETDAASFRLEALKAGGPDALSDAWDERASIDGLWADFLLFAPEELWKRLLPQTPCPELLFREIIDLSEEDSKRRGNSSGEELRKVFDAAMRLARMALEKSPLNPAGWFGYWDGKRYVSGWIGDLPFSLGRAGLIEEAITLCRSWAQVIWGERFLGDLVVILAQAGRREEALAQIEENHRRFPKDFWVRVHSGDALRELGDWRGALVRYREAEPLARDDEDRGAALDRQNDVLQKRRRDREES